LTPDGEIAAGRGHRLGANDDPARRRGGHLGATLAHDLGHREDEFGQTLTGLRRDREDPVSGCFDVGGDDFGQVAGIGHVDLVQSHQARPVFQAAVVGQLLLDDLQIAERFASGFPGGAVDDVDDGLAPLDVAQEVVAQAAAFAGSLDQAGHIGDGEGGFSGHHHAQIGDQRGERIVGDLRLCRRNRRDQTGFAGARVADQADVGQHLELEVDDAFVAFLAEEGEAGRLAGRRGERGVAQPALAAACHHDLVDLPEIGEHTAGSFVGDDGALGHHQDDVFAVGAVAVPTHAGLPVLGLAHRLPVVVDQRCQTGIGAQDDRSAVAAVAAVRAAERLELLAVHGRAAMASIACADGEPRAVNE